MKFPKQLFYIPAETWRSLDPDEVRATADALKQLNLYHLPYPVVTVRVSADDLVSWYDNTPNAEKQADEIIRLRRRGHIIRGPDGRNWLNFGPGAWVEYSNLCLEDPKLCRKTLMTYKHATYADRQSSGDMTVSEIDLTIITDALIVLLATRNAVKSTIEHKAAKLGIGKGDKRYSYVTTITVPKALDEDHESVKGNGAARAPHLRRGHIRHQPYGPKRAFTKDVWIAPMFINADPDWVSKRERYNVSL